LHFTTRNNNLFSRNVKGTRVMGLFLRSEAPGLVFSEEKNSGLPPPPKSDGIFDSHFRKTP
jgi:hypothetical protein